MKIFITMLFLGSKEKEAYSCVSLQWQGCKMCYRHKMRCYKAIRSNKLDLPVTTCSNANRSQNNNAEWKKKA